METPIAESGMVKLDNELVVAYRPIQPADREALQRFHARHSDRSNYLRFFSVQRELGEPQARYFTELDGQDRFALVALDPNDPGEIIGVVRFDRASDAETAEYAAIVADDWQGHGLGSELTRILIACAKARHIRTLVAYVLPENYRMLNLFHGLELPEDVHFQDEVERIEMDISGGVAG